MKLLEGRNGKKRSRTEAVVVSEGNSDAGDDDASEEGERDTSISTSGIVAPLHPHVNKAQAAPIPKTDTSKDEEALISMTSAYKYGSVDNNLELEEESYVASDASSQYSNKMDLCPEDRKAGCDAEDYLRQNPLGRAFPERTLALLVTLMLELPTLFIISGGSDKLCGLIGRRRYQLLVAFLPLTSAISGNVGLQASTLTTRAISHLHITKHSYCVWLYKEVVAAAYQGFGMGTVSGIFAYVASGHDVAFGFTIFLAQFTSILTAGFTGTLAPLIFTFVFRRDSGQWGGPLETAIQDIVGSFAMVILSYHVLDWLGPHEISEADMC